MPISDFFGCEAGFKQKPAARLRFGGGALLVRYATVEQALRVYSKVAPKVDVLQEIEGKSPSEVIGSIGSEFLPLARDIFYILNPDETPDRFEQATGEELVEWWNWYLTNHDLGRIMRDLFGIGKDEELADPEDTVRHFRIVEEKSGRKIEELLQMRAEAFLTLVEDLYREAKESQPQRYGFSWGDVNNYFGGGAPGGIVEN